MSRPKIKTEQHTIATKSLAIKNREIVHLISAAFGAPRDADLTYRLDVYGNVTGCQVTWNVRAETTEIAS